MVDDVAERLEAPEILRVDRTHARYALLESGEDLDALDGVDAEIGVESHVELEHLGGIAGLLGDDHEEALGKLLACSGVLRRGSPGAKGLGSGVTRDGFGRQRDRVC